MSSELDEITHTLQTLRAELEDVVVGGLRTFGPERLPVLRARVQELDRIGASHLAGKLSELTAAIERNERGSAAALMRAQASLRLFERLLTLELARERLAFVAGTAAENEDEDEQA